MSSISHPPGATPSRWPRRSVLALAAGGLFAPWIRGAHGAPGPRVAGSVAGGSANGRFTAPIDVTTAAGDTYLTTFVGQARANLLYHVVSADGAFDAPVILSARPENRDSHAEASLLQTAEGGYLALHTGHSEGYLHEATARDPGAWSGRDIQDQVGDGPGARFTYAGLRQHHAEPGRPVYAFLRMTPAGRTGGLGGPGPHVARGLFRRGRWHWSRAERLLRGRRPYLVTATAGGAVTHVFTNRGHPVATGPQGVYHAEFRAGGLFVGSRALALPASPAADLDVVQPETGVDWVMDAAVMADGTPCVTWARILDPERRRMQAWWARRIRVGAWSVHRVAEFTAHHPWGNAGIVMDPLDPTRVFFEDRAGGVQQLFRARFDGARFGPAAPVTGFAEGISGVRFLTSRRHEPRLVVRSPVDGRGRRAVTAGDAWTFTVSPWSVVIASDGHTARLPGA